MKTYLVGGAIRDNLLNLQVKDRDYVVVGATPEQMIKKGFKPVGRDFPVFLHPETHEEYALARTERKTAKGYHGFTFNTDVSVTIEDDLARRDLTINAIAQDIENGEIIDPYGGKQDIKTKQLRHVSQAFAEDPVRILRTARFAARYSYLGFQIHADTLSLMMEMVANGEVDALVAERVWQEMKHALNENTPSQFIKVLRSCGALKVLFPEFDRLFGIPQTIQWHPEVDTGIHCMMAMDQAATLDNDTAFAVLTHDLGKGITPESVLPSHKGHESAGVPLVKDVCQRFKVPTQYKKLAVMVCRWHLHSHTAFELRPATIDKLFRETRAYQSPLVFNKFLQACKADATGRLGKEQEKYPQAEYLLACLNSAMKVNVRELIENGYSGKTLGEMITRERKRLIKRVKLSWLFLR